MNKEQWILCPYCKEKTRIKVRDDTIFENPRYFFQIQKIKYSSEGFPSQRKSRIRCQVRLEIHRAHFPFFITIFIGGTV